MVDAVNRRSGRCDPGLERIGEVTGLSTRAVMRSLRSLMAARLFRIDRHHGYSMVHPPLESGCPFGRWKASARNGLH